MLMSPQSQSLAPFLYTYLQMDNRSAEDRPETFVTKVSVLVVNNAEINTPVKLEAFKSYLPISTIASSEWNKYAAETEAQLCRGL